MKRTIILLLTVITLTTYAQKADNFRMQVISFEENQNTESFDISLYTVNGNKFNILFEKNFIFATKIL